MNIYTLCRDLCIQDPFAGFILSNMYKEPFTENYDAAVGISNNKITLYYNPKLLSKLPRKSQIAVIQHEIYHVVCKHLNRFWTTLCPNKEVRNIAMDITINQWIDDLPNYACVHTAFKLPAGLNTKEYYDKLIEVVDKNIKHTSGYHEYFGTNPDFEDRIVDSQINGIVKNAVDKGIFPSNSDLKSYVKNLLLKEFKPIVNWNNQLRRYLNSSFRKRIRISKKWESKRFPDCSGVSLKRERSVLIALDASGSIDDTVFERFSAEINNILRQANYIKIDVVQFADKLETDILPWKTVKKLVERPSYGGTLFNPVLELYNDNWQKYDVLIMLTDGGYFENKLIKTKKPVCYVIYDNTYFKESGTIIHINKNDI